MSSESPIGLFDSGFGGLTVMREVVRLLPHENLIYLGDTAHLPYGNKSPEVVLQYALENASFLLKKGIKLLMVPCHTACSHALATLQETFPIPIIGVIQPGLDLLGASERIGVIGTASTIESGIYQSLIRKQIPHAQIHAKACPLFVPLIEEGFHSHASATLIAESYLAPLKGQIDTALLACTHYPLIRSILQQILGPKVALLEPAERCAALAREYLTNTALLNRQKGRPVYEFYVTDDPEKFRRFGKLFFGAEIEKVEKK